jgi:hypothetical protein
MKDYTRIAKEWLDARIPPDCTQAEYQWFRSGALTLARYLSEQEREKPVCCEKCWVPHNEGWCDNPSCPCHKPTVCEHEMVPQYETKSGVKLEYEICALCGYATASHQAKPTECEHEWTAVSLDLPTSIFRCKKCGAMKEWGKVKPHPERVKIEELDCWICNLMHGHIAKKLDEVIKALNALTKQS